MSFTQKQKRALKQADLMGRAFVTEIEGRICIVLPPVTGNELSDEIARIAALLGDKERAN